MSQPSDNPKSKLPEALVAYLDGELSPEASSRMEARLRSDGTLRSELRRLERVWDCLDHLPRADVDESFAHSTVEMVALSAEQENVKSLSSLSFYRRHHHFATAIALFASCLVSMLLILVMRPNTERQLIRDLPVLDNLDIFLQVEDIEFLRRLHEENLFPEEPTDEPQ